jgi:hypothetical protein
MTRSYYRGFALDYESREKKDEQDMYTYCCNKYFNDISIINETGSDYTSTVIDNDCKNDDNFKLFYCLSCLLSWKW